MQEVTRASRLALVVALAAAAPALAIELGQIEPRSSLGEVLDARIPFTISAGSSVDASCFALVREATDGRQMLGEGVLTIERRLGEKALRIRTVAPVMEPGLTIRIRAACPGSGDGQTREFALMLQARAESAPAAIAAPAVTTPAPTAEPIARLAARGGESLESLATKVYPRNPVARGRFLAGLRELNPELAALGPNEPIPEDAPIALPDLRKLPAAAPAPAARPRTRLAEAAPPPPKAEAEPAPKPEPAPRKAARTAKAPPPAAPSETLRAPAPEKRAATAPRAASPGGYVLKLSSSEVDLTRSRQIDDRMRAQLRERLLVLDADDQVAAMLSMRHSLKQLEARVAEMQLKLDSMPASLAARAAAQPAPAPKVEAAPARKAEPPPPKVEPTPPKVEPAPPRPEPPKVAVAPKVEPPAPVKAEPPAPKPEPPRIEPPVVEAPVVKTAPPAPVRTEPPPIVTPPTKASTRLPPPVDPGLPPWLWAVAAALVALAGLIGWWMWRRRNAEPVDESSMPVHEPATEMPVDIAADAPAEAPSVASEDHIEIAEEVRPQISSDATLSTRLQSDSGELRRRYIEERFPEIQNRTIVLEDPASVVKGARLFYEDGALPRAVELLQFVIEDKPSELRPWLALFEIFRLERLTGEFAELAQRFKDLHGKDPFWQKVQYFGREIDPGNPLYREEPLNTLETIGPREAKRLAAGLSSVGPTGPSFDPIAENWLNAPMDFENEVLANELRNNLMAGASMTEQDLIPNPMPALRSVEMFNVT